MTKRPKRALLFWVRAVPRVNVVASICATHFAPREAVFLRLHCPGAGTSRETLRTLQTEADFGSILGLIGKGGAGARGVAPALASIVRRGSRSRTPSGTRRR